MPAWQHEHSGPVTGIWSPALPLPCAAGNQAGKSRQAMHSERGYTSCLPACLRPRLTVLGERLAQALRHIGSDKQAVHLCYLQTLKPFQSPAPSAGNKLACARRHVEQDTRSRRVGVK